MKLPNLPTRIALFTGVLTAGALTASLYALIKLGAFKGELLGTIAMLSPESLSQEDRTLAQAALLKTSAHLSEVRLVLLSIAAITLSLGTVLFWNAFRMVLRVNSALSKIVIRLAMSSNEIGNTSREVAMSSDELFHGTKSQAEALKERSFV